MPVSPISSPVTVTVQLPARGAVPDQSSISTSDSTSPLSGLAPPMFAMNTSPQAVCTSW